METKHVVATIEIAGGGGSSTSNKQNKLDHILQHLCHLQQKKHFIVNVFPVPVYKLGSNQSTDYITMHFYLAFPWHKI